jgi:hypothetical protein
LYPWFPGQSGFGQNAVPFSRGEKTTALETGEDSFFREIPNFSASFSIASSLSFVPSPCSNMESADCLQPTSAASTLCEIPASRRASRILLQISGSRFITAYIMPYIVLFFKEGFINTYQQIYKLVYPVLIFLFIILL